MRNNVPFFKQTTTQNCGPVALKMVLGYLGKDKPLEELEKLCGLREGKAISTLHMAIAAQRTGFRAVFYSKSLMFNEDNLKEEYYKKITDAKLLEELRGINKEAEKLGVTMIERGLDLSEIVDIVSEGDVPIVLIDWNLIRGRKGYQGHFVPVVGYDDDNVYIHNSGFENTGSFVSIEKDLFDKARKVFGTDEDVLIVKKL